MPAVPIQPRVKHRAATRRVPRTRANDTESNAAPDPEPNMRLSRALLVMLLLHVVAVGGILAFSLIKEHGRTHAVASPTSNAVEAEDSDAQPTNVESRDSNRPPADPAGTLAAAHPSHTSEPVTRVANDPASNNPANDAALRIAGGGTNSGGPSAPPASANADKNGHLPTDSGKTYVVKKGDSPYTIADHFKVEVPALLKLNGIDDPKKLKLGQTLKIPAAAHGKLK